MGSPGRASHTATAHSHLAHSVTGSQRMDKITILLLVGGAFAQKKFYTTKFDDCGSSLDIPPALQGSVKMTAPFNRVTGRHVLGKGKEVQICIEGKLNATSNLPLPIEAPFGLKNSAHGKVELGPLTVPLPVDFCSTLTVPTQSPDVNVEVPWKVLLEDNFQDECEQTYDIEELKSQGKYPLVCIKIPARVQVPRG